MSSTYFYIDGSALTAQIRQLRRADPKFSNRRLCPREFINCFMDHLAGLHGGVYKRAIFYSPRGDEANIREYIRVPIFSQPGVFRNISFKFCGHKLKKSAEFDKWVEERVPSKFQGRFSKSEKGIDIEMCCDALRLSITSQVDRIFLLTNDGDFIPFCRAIKDFGTNISIVHLSSATQPNIDLINEVDSYDIVPENILDRVILVDDNPAEERAAGTDDVNIKSNPQLEKPDAPPSDLNNLQDEGDRGPPEIE